MDGGAPIRFYLVERLDVSDGGLTRDKGIGWSSSDHWLPVGEVRPSEHQLRVDGLRAGREYLFRVSAGTLNACSQNKFSWLYLFRCSVAQ